MNRFLLLFLAAATLALAGCAGGAKPDDTQSTSDVDGNGNKVSSIPWNRPQSWEGGGMLGGAMGH
ncbi:hypothetical protein SAMN05444156_1816 [Verrucomicrobium sp. GAS474]|uniref:hypothetical protein n=1 Tax=Verrucomicrobium sp. GAS474 TaxID=1882831 RepID=UPI00087DEF2E|nr:hypothetical protein [Verrucomicrobium sp. GAS474]SDU07554.1 hypothetical protein SAMN05444156_1816 [Verrucomicrobium sp. GAS474]